jgi:hypothetical protein
MQRSEIRDGLSALHGPGLRLRSMGHEHQTKKARSRDRAFSSVSSNEPAYAAFDTSTSLSISSVPIR